jgi:chemotaxis protein methyltransferase CheR
MKQDEFEMFRKLVHDRTGIWLREGKQIMLASRLSRRLRHHGLVNFSDYYQFVQAVHDNGEELRELINCVTTNKTSFFRERHHFDFLADTVVPRIKAGTRPGMAKIVRIWSACCSTGEEPYSIAITLLEALQSQQRILVGSAEGRSSVGDWKIEIIASDIDTVVLGKASRAIYPDDSLDSVDQSMQKKYFLRGKDDMQGQVKVKPSVASLVEFKRINLMDQRWPIDIRFDAIFFRNALIYFNQDTQDMFLRRMAAYLKPQGYLFLGNSEHIPWLAHIFAPLNKTMYQLRDLGR